MAPPVWPHCRAESVWPYQARIELVLSTARVTSIKSEKGVEGT